MSHLPNIYIAGTGMITPLGANTAMTAYAVRAGICAFGETGFYLDEDNHVRMARVPQGALEHGLSREDFPDGYSARQIRLLQLAILALVDLLPKLPADTKFPLFLAGPEQLVEGDKPIDREFLKKLTEFTGIDLDLSMSRLISTGRPGGLAAVDLAFRLFASTEHEYAIVGGVDTYYDGRVLQTLLKDKRLLVGGNPDGFIPGEGAAFILLSKQKTTLHKDTQKTVSLHEPGFGVEPGYRGSEETYRGDGLASAVAKALANADVAKVKTLYSTMNGENFFSKEHGVAMIRNESRLDENMLTEHPADCFGDLGAACIPVILGIASFHLEQGHTSAPCLVCGSSDKEERAAIVMHDV